MPIVRQPENCCLSLICSIWGAFARYQSLPLLNCCPANQSVNCKWWSNNLGSPIPALVGVSFGNSSPVSLLSSNLTRYPTRWFNSPLTLTMPQLKPNMAANLPRSSVDPGLSYRFFTHPPSKLNTTFLWPQVVAPHLSRTTTLLPAASFFTTFQILRLPHTEPSAVCPASPSWGIEAPASNCLQDDPGPRSRVHGPLS